MEYFLAEVKAPSGSKWYELVKANSVQEAEEKVKARFGYDYNVDIQEAIE